MPTKWVKTGTQVIYKVAEGAIGTFEKNVWNKYYSISG